MIIWAALGIFFKVVIWIIGFLFLVKGNIKIYFWNEFFSIIYTLILNLVGYHFMGLTGLGISFFTSHLISTLQYYVTSHIIFSFTFNTVFIRLFIYQFGFAVIAILGVILLGGPYPYIIGLMMILCSVGLSYRELDRRLEIRSLLAGKRHHI